MKHLISLFVFIVGLTGSAHAALKLPALFQDHMVLQRDAELPIWGWGDAGSEVTVQFKGEEKKAKVDAKGEWQLRLEALPASADPALFTVRSGNDVITLKDVLVGEVWICSGQSNMDWTMSRAKDAKLEIASANYSNIRLFKVERKSIPEQQDDCAGEWAPCTSESAKDFSAVGFFFGRQIHTAIQVPVGLIHTAWGGTPSEGWTRAAVVEAEPSMEPLMERWAQQIKEKKDGTLDKKHKERMEAWKKAKAKAEAEKKDPPKAPRKFSDPETAPHRPGNLYNGMIAPLIPYAMKGAIWYQGESNQSRAFQYRTLFPMMIQNWRDDWKQGDFPFYFVQIANFQEKKDEPGDSSWAEVREAQTMTLDKLQHVGQAVIIDIGMAKDIHPKNKQDVGKRLARLVLVNDYGLDFHAESPRFKQMTIDGKRITLTFGGVGDGLMAWDKQDLEGFAVAGEDKQFVWATTQKIKGKDKVELVAEGIEKPVAVRYSWANNPNGNLFNKAELPVTPFRTDDWPGVTDDNH